MKFNKTMCALVASTILISNSVFAQAIILSPEQHESISNGLNSFATTLLTVIPQASTQQNLWADAYIGKLLPSLPPHLGGGLTIGGTQLDMSGFKTAASGLMDGYNSAADKIKSVTDIAAGLGISTAIDIPTLDFGDIPDTFFMPTASLDLRLGGFFLPFDIGICAMMTNPNIFALDMSDPSSITNISSPMNFGWAGFNGTFDYISLGVDVRYAVFEGNLIIPAISLGGGYYYTKGQFDTNTSSSPTIDGIGVQTTTADMNLTFNTQVVYLQAAASKSFAVVTVFGGLRGLLSSSSNAWAWSYKTENDVSALSGTAATTVASGLKSEDKDSGTVSSGNGISDTYTKGDWDFSAIQPQIFAGIGFNFFMFQTTLGVSYDLTWLYKQTFFDSTTTQKDLWSASFSFHAKI